MSWHSIAATRAVVRVRCAESPAAGRADLHTALMDPESTEVVIPRRALNRLEIECA